MTSLKQQLKQIKGSVGVLSPRSSWKQETRETLMRTMARTAARPSTIQSRISWLEFVGRFIPRQVFVFVARPIAVLAMVMSIGGVGWIASASAANSLPGDMLYSVKMAAEKTKVVFVSAVGDDEEQAKLHLELAVRRAEEVKLVLEKKNDATLPASAAEKKAMKNLKDNLEKSSKALESMAQKNPEKAADLMKSTDVQTDKITDALAEASKLTTETELSKEVAASSKAAAQTNMIAIEIALEANSGDEEVRKFAEEKVAEIIDAAEATAKTVDNVASSTISGLPIESGLLPAVTASTTAGTVTATTSLPLVTDAAAMANQVAEVKELVNTDTAESLKEAVKKAKEIQSATLDTKQALAGAAAAPVVDTKVQGGTIQKTASST